MRQSGSIEAGEAGGVEKDDWRGVMGEYCHKCKPDDEFVVVELCGLHARAADYRAALEGIVERGHGNHCNAHYVDDETGQPHPCSCHVALADVALKGGE